MFVLTNVRAYNMPDIFGRELIVNEISARMILCIFVKRS